MPRFAYWLAAAGLFIIAVPAAQAPGAIVAVGGGGTTPAIVQRTLELAGGSRAVVTVLPQSSAVEGAGDSSVKMWLDAGAKSARKIDFGDPDAKAAIQTATLIWMPGGDQNRFMKTIAGTGLDDAIRERHRAGAVVGGTSAGAAVLSAAMITGDADLQSLSPGKTVLAKGLGLWPDAIVDQHFLRRQRNNRLLAAVIEHPRLIGVGIDEATAAILRNGRIEVVGRSAVVVFDARHARVEPPAAGPVAATGVALSVLREGMELPVGSNETQGARARMKLGKVLLFETAAAGAPSVSGSHLFQGDRGGRKGQWLRVSPRDGPSTAAAGTEYHLVAPDAVGALPDIDVLGIHYVKVRPDRREAFEKFVREKLHPTVGNLRPDLRLLYYKAVRGPETGNYIAIFALTRESRDKYWPGGSDSDALRAAFKAAQPLAAELLTYLAEGSALTDEKFAARVYESREWADFVLVPGRPQ
jgi:cyanophycinase